MWVRGYLNKREEYLLSKYYKNSFYFSDEKKRRLPRKLKKEIGKVLDKCEYYDKLYPPPQYRIGSGTITADRLKKL